MGLTNYVFTESLSRAFRVSEAIQSGTVAVNTPMANAAESPFGGIKESGFGKEGGLKHGVEEFCVLKATAIAL
jgi:succinate-semialdehyde dehydrogenase/glutarate-semialdehyde dehydrogenase